MAIEVGWITINGKKVSLDYILRNGDVLTHTTHRHEPPVTADEITFVKDDDKDLLIVHKPSSIPVHPTGRYRANTITEILKHEHPGLFPRDAQGKMIMYHCNRLDRLTSGIVFVALSQERARLMEQALRDRVVDKEYVCRVTGEFPEGEIVCNEPLLTVNYKLALNAVSEEGKPCTTIFQRLSYNGFTSVVHCKPITGRSHQIRVHLQWLGHPIANDPLYENAIWAKFQGSSPATAYVARQVAAEMIRQNHATMEKQEDCEKVEDAEQVIRCADCAFPKPDYKPWELCIWLHSYRYSSDDWSYEAPLPEWAHSDYSKDREITSWLHNRRIETEEL